MDGLCEVCGLPARRGKRGPLGKTCTNAHRQLKYRRQLRPGDPLSRIGFEVPSVLGMIAAKSRADARAVARMHIADAVIVEQARRGPSRSI